MRIPPPTVLTWSNASSPSSLILSAPRVSDSGVKKHGVQCPPSGLLHPRHPMSGRGGKGLLDELAQSFVWSVRATADTEDALGPQ